MQSVRYLDPEDLDNGDVVLIDTEKLHLKLIVNDNMIHVSSLDDDENEIDIGLLWPTPLRIGYPIYTVKEVGFADMVHSADGEIIVENTETIQLDRIIDIEVYNAR